MCSTNAIERYAPGKTAPYADAHLGDVPHLEDPPGVVPHLVGHPREDRRLEDPQLEDPRYEDRPLQEGE